MKSLSSHESTDQADSFAFRFTRLTRPLNPTHRWLALHLIPFTSPEPNSTILSREITQDFYNAIHKTLQGIMASSIG
jgi:hypothetical protein